MTPSANRAFIDLTTGAVRSSATSPNAPRIAGILGTQLALVVSFFRDSVPTALADGSQGKFVLKPKLAHGSPALVLDIAWAASGDGSARTYSFDALLDSESLRAGLEGKDSEFFAGQIEWTIPGETDPSKSLPFDVIVVNAYSREGDEAPDPIASASWEWLKQRAPEGNGFTHDEEAKTLAVAGGGIVEETDPLAMAALASHTADTNNPHGVTKTQLGLGNVDNTSDANKPVSSATQAALNGKEPTQTQASQAEAEAGTGTAIRSWTPQRIGQAIAALGGGGGNPIVTPKVLHVSASGSDTTGDGSLNAPYATAQKAFDVAFAGTGNYVLMFGVGNFGTVLCPSGWPERVAVAGMGMHVSFINSIQAESLGISGAPGAEVSIHGNGAITLAEVHSRGAEGATASAGGDGNSIKLWDVGYSAISVDGGMGGVETDPGISGDGGAGGNAGQFTLRNCIDVGGGAKSALGGSPGAGGAAGYNGLITDVRGEHRVAAYWTGDTRYAHLCLFNSGDTVTMSGADNTDTCATY